jgi:hypothetical protein
MFSRLRLAVIVFSLVLSFSGLVTAASNANSCSDSDGGKVSAIVGKVSGYYNKLFYSNIDYCYDPGNVNEYFCVGTTKGVAKINCGVDVTLASCVGNSLYKNVSDYYCNTGACRVSKTLSLIKSCPYGCANGACNTRMDSCTDTDNGNNNGLRGTISGYLASSYYSSSDYCSSSSYLIEYNCNGAKAINISVYCPFGCLNGICKPNTDTCIDSDGNETNTSGYVYGYLDTKFYSIYDSCMDFGTVSENFCRAGYSYSFSTSCQFGCSYGKCNPFPQSCSDSDEGFSVNEQGVTSGVYKDSKYSNQDYCLGDSSLMEYYCGGNIEYNWSFSCQHGCVNGACAIQNPNSCYDSDNGLFPQVKGNVSGYKNDYFYTNVDYCFNSTTLQEYTCMDGTDYLNSTLDCTKINGGIGCVGGACI